ncbi:MAG: hypothetical protein HGA80_07390 [Candidatus Omnitrophica bacterium]|nr:hypothetical protein [Candidatus Omnitrophota bacterium]
MTSKAFSIKVVGMAFFIMAWWGMAGSMCEAAALSQSEQALVSLYAQARTIEAVQVDIERFAVYHKGNQGFWEERIAQDLQQLRLARAGVAEKSWPSDVELVRSYFLSAEKALEDYSEAFLRAQPKEVYKADDLLSSRYERLRNKLDQLATAVITPSRLPEDFDPLEEEFRMFTDADDREAFRQAAFLLEEKRFDVAWGRLAKMLEKYRGTPAEGCIVLRMVRSVLRDHTADLPGEKEKEQIKLLEDLLDSRVYYPNVYDIYLEWRSLYQGFYYGLAADAEIPNLQYLAKAETVVDTLLFRLESQPRDEWARAQLWMLVRIPVLTRSGTVSPGLGGDPLGGE